LTTFEGIIPRLPVQDLRRTIAYYTGELGFEVSVLWPQEEPTFCLLDRDGVRIGFYVPEKSSGNPSERPGELCIEVSDVRALHRELAPRLVIEWGPEVYSYGRREFAVRDPNGYLVIFGEESDDPATSDVDD
jgi:catechol 2,3-dioxygenase-like lactoylglutathione lyase family enzyme